MLVIINPRGIGSGEWRMGKRLFPNSNSQLPTPHSLLYFRRDRDRLALWRQFELKTPQIERYAEMLQIISAQNPVLFKPGSFIDRFEVQDHGARVVLSQTIDRQRQQADHFDAVFDAGRADD